MYHKNILFTETMIFTAKLFCLRRVKCVHWLIRSLNASFFVCIFYSFGINNMLLFLAKCISSEEKFTQFEYIFIFILIMYLKQSHTTKYIFPYAFQKNLDQQLQWVTLFSWGKIILYMAYNWTTQNDSYADDASKDIGNPLRIKLIQLPLSVRLQWTCQRIPVFRWNSLGNRWVMCC